MVKTIFFLDANKDIAARVFLNVVKRRIISYQELKNTGY